MNRLYADLAALRMRLALARLALKLGFDPNQPRRLLRLSHRPACRQQLDQLGAYHAAAQLTGFGITFASQLLAYAQHAFAGAAPGQREGAFQAGGAVIHGW